MSTISYLEGGLKEKIRKVGAFVASERNIEIHPDINKNVPNGGSS